MVAGPVVATELRRLASSLRTGGDGIVSDAATARGLACWLDDRAGELDPPDSSS